MTHKEDYSSEFDIYLSGILDRLREKYGYASVNRFNQIVRIFYREFITATEQTIKYLEIPNSEIEDCMKNKTLPTKIKELL